MKVRNVSYFIILFSLLIILTGCNRTIEFEGITISANDNYYLSLSRDKLYEKDKWSFSDKKKVLDIIQRMTPSYDREGTVIGMGPVLRIENDDYSIEICFSGDTTIAYITKGDIAKERKWYICSGEDTMAIMDFVLPKGWNNRPRE